MPIVLHIFQVALYVSEIAVALGLIILVHELGHFLAAKAFGVWVRKFAIGFGPPIVKWQRGETEYSLRWIPLGGFVEPMGDHPECEGGDSPRALWRRPAWQKIVIFAAGVVMNGVLAVVFFTAAAMIGLKAPSSVIGEVQPFSPAARAGIEPGDRIVDINGNPVHTFEDIQSIVVSQSAGSLFDVTVERRVPGKEEPARLTLSGIRSVRSSEDMAPRLGVSPVLDTIIAKFWAGGPEDQAGLKPQDNVLAVNGKAVARWRQMTEALSHAPPGPVTLTIEREGKQRDLTIDPAKLKMTDIGMDPPTVIALVEPDGPAAKAGVRAKDRIAAVNESRWPSEKKITEIVEATEKGGQVRLTVLRDGRDVEMACTPEPTGKDGKPQVGIGLSAAVSGKPLQVGAVEPDGPAAKAGLQPGDNILTVNGKEATDWDAVRQLAMMAGGKPLELVVRRGQEESAKTLAPVVKPLEKFELLTSTPAGYRFDPVPPVYNPVTAAGKGFKRTGVSLQRTYSLLLMLARGDVGKEALGGPVMVAGLSWKLASYGIGTFIDFWGMISVFIAVFNFLPVPPFDGGHALFVILEKIKGSPIALKVRAYIWGAAWVGLILLFVLITWQDITFWLTR